MMNEFKALWRREVVTCFIVMFQHLLASTRNLC